MAFQYTGPKKNVDIQKKIASFAHELNGRFDGNNFTLGLQVYGQDINSK